MVASELFSSLAAPVFAAMLFIFFLKRRSREINGGEANNNAAANDGTAGGDSGTHTSTEVPEVATSSGANKDAAANDGTAGGDSGTHTSTEVPELPTSSGYDYEVFLSFRGPDTRAAFTDFLYTSLDDAGIRTFKDDESLRIGEEFAPELLQAINQSKISIPIFSKGYASSVWCLKELVQMVECQKTGRQKIMPIFYDVAPSEVRYQTEGYAKAFLAHKKKKRHDEKTIQEWKDALSVVGELNGWDLHSEEENRREGEFTRKLTQKVFSELKKAYLVVSDCLVSVDNHVDAIKEMIGARTSETWIIGIHGMGGIGKTTIAKIIYNQLSENFEGCCFLSDIREMMSECKGVECLQNQLISDILKKKCTDIRNIDDGIKIIKDRLSNKRILLLLDDVHETNHMSVLVGKCDWFGKGSKLIITTRNKQVLDAFKVDDCYEVMGMDRDQSLQLFSKHAFRRDSPLDEYIDQSNKVIDIAKGLPLTLEVIGSLLSYTEKRKWNDILEELENVPCEEVQRKLKISYDALKLQHKHIFLDIACLFIGYEKDVMVHFWEKSKFFPIGAMEVLQNMSLIKIEEHNRVWMHDQLRDLGRDIVRKESDMKIEKQSRVWDPKEGLDLLRKHKRSKEVEALRLKLDHQPQYCFTYEGFESLSDLRFLIVGGSMENFRAEERLLWPESPSNVPPTNDEITDDWKGWSHMEVMKNLKVLELSYCQHLKTTPNFSAHSNLERLILSSCESLTEIDKSICRLKHLVSLNVSYCENLQRLPDELGGDLASLEYLSLEFCESLERLPDTIGNLESLIELDLSSTEIEELPDSIGKLKNLKVVKMEYSHISKIPDAFWTIEKLEEIHAVEMEFRERCHVNIGNCISKNQSLRILTLGGADIYALPPRLPESLVELQLADLCMDTFPDLSNLTNLGKLDLRFSGRGYDGKSHGPVEDPIPRWMENLSKLRDLSLRFDCETASTTNLSRFPPQLRSLHLECPKLRCLPTLPSSLSSLILHDCESLCSMEDLSNLKNLSILHISGTAIAEIRGLGCLEDLQYLLLGDLNEVKILPDLSNLNKLRILKVRDCSDLVEIQGELLRFLDSLDISSCHSLPNLPHLSSLISEQGVSISDCRKLNVESILVYARMNPQRLSLRSLDQLQILPDLSNSDELRRLKVNRCRNLGEIQGELPQSLEELNISNCESLQKLPDLSSLMGLREVCISECGSLVEIQGELPESLEELEISSCESLQKLPDLSSLMGLREVCISECGSLVEIQGELPQSLKELEISSCESLQKLPDLSSLMGLREVCISECGSLVEIQGELPQSLEKLEISSCESLQKLPDLSSLMGLREVCISECGSLVEIQGELPQSLKKLEISYCESLQKLPDLSSLMGLREVCISECGSLVEIQGELPQSLEKLEISSCESLQKLPDLSSLMGLREVCISEYGSLVEIQGELPQSLEKLEIFSRKSLQKLPDLSSLKGLREVYISKCDSLAEIQGELPQSLEKLKIFSCKSLQKLPDLSSLKGLREVCISRCGSLAEIQGELPQSLEKLEISSCKSLQKLPDLSSLKGLRKVCISKCGSLAEIQGELPQSLEKLEISSCKSLQKLPDLSSFKGLPRRVKISCCRKLNMEAISLLCLEKSVEFVGSYSEDEESESEREDDESESEYEGEDKE